MVFWELLHDSVRQGGNNYVEITRNARESSLSSGLTHESRTVKTLSFSSSSISIVAVVSALDSARWNEAKPMTA